MSSIEYYTPCEFRGFPRIYLPELVVGHAYSIRGRHFEWSVQITERHETHMIVRLISYHARRLHDRVSACYSAEPGSYKIIPINLIDAPIDQDDPTDSQQFYHFFQVPPPPPPHVESSVSIDAGTVD